MKTTSEITVAYRSHQTSDEARWLHIDFVMPIFVARALGILDDASYGDEPTFYAPKTWRSRTDALDLDQSVRDMATKNVNLLSLTSLATYDRLINDGIAPDMAVMVLPLNLMRKFHWSDTLPMWASICKQHLDNAEARAVIEKIVAIASEHFPEEWPDLIGGKS